MAITIEYAYSPDFSVDELYPIYVEAIQDLSLYRDNPGSEQDIKNNILAFLPQTTSTERALFVAKVDDEIVGFIIGLVSPNILNHSIKTASELFLWVRKEHRKSRIAVRLVKAFEQWASWAGCHSTSLSFYRHKDELDLDKLYTKLGYRSVETTYIKELE